MHRHLRKKRQKLYIAFLVSLGLTVFTTIFLAIIIYANWDAVVSEVAYAVNPPTTPITPNPQPTTSHQIPATSTPQPIVEAPHLLIPKLGLDVPITWDVPVDKVVDTLSHGVAHLQGTAHPGQIGNVFIIGHSSDYVWKHNPYAATFALLPKLQPGDTITIRENGQVFDYKLTSTQIVNPDQVEVANQTDTPILTLLTCYPVGTTRQRYVVRAAMLAGPIQPTSIKQNPNEKLPTIQFR